MLRVPKAVAYYITYSYTCIVMICLMCPHLPSVTLGALGLTFTYKAGPYCYVGLVGGSITNNYSYTLAIIAVQIWMCSPHDVINLAKIALMYILTKTNYNL